MQPVLRFEFIGTGALTALSSIPPCPASLVNDPSYAVFNSHKELFVSNRHGNIGGSIGSIARFTFDTAGNFFANGSITGNSLEAVHGLAFSPIGELFAANLFNGTISRFRFDAAGDAFPNGTVATGFFPPQNQNQGLAFAPNGELFVTHSNSVVQRFLLDPGTGAAIPNGTFSVPESISLHGLTFNVGGELFIADGGGVVFRFLFDSAGNPVGNGSIPVSGGPLGVTFSSAGELFVTSHVTGGISRFLFDGSGNAIPNGFIATPNLGGVAIFPLAALLEVSIDIKPESCPNPFNVLANGRLPVAILGTQTFDVTTVEPTSVKLHGVSSLRAVLEDVATPFVGTPIQAADCTTAGPDGLTDLVLFFDDQAVAAALGSVTDGQVLVLALTGNLKPEFGGTPIMGRDVVVIRGR